MNYAQVPWGSEIRKVKRWEQSRAIYTTIFCPIRIERKLRNFMFGIVSCIRPKYVTCNVVKREQIFCHSLRRKMDKLRPQLEYTKKGTNNRL